MSCPFNKESLAQLKQFIDIVKTKPEILHLPEIAFFKEFIEYFGGVIPEIKKMPTESKSPEPEPVPIVESDPESELEFDMEGCVEPDEIDPNQDVIDVTKEISEEETNEADEIRMRAQTQFAEGNFDKVVELYTAAMKINPSALLFAKRGQAYLKLSKPNACIKDCSRALEINPDSAAAYKFRGRAFRLIAEWEKAAKDLRQACKIDFDEQADEWLREVTPNAKKIEQHNLKLERKKIDKEEKEKLERIRKAKEAHANVAKTEVPQDIPGAGTGAGAVGMDDILLLLQDPEIIAAFHDPEVSAAFQDIFVNPANYAKYESNPKMKTALETLFVKFKEFGFPSSGDAGVSGGTFPGAGFPGAGFPGAGFPGDRFPGAPGGATGPAADDDGLD